MTEEQLKKLDADVLAAINAIGANFQDEAPWLNVTWIYNNLPLCTHREVDHAVTRLHDGGEIETKHVPMCHGKEEFYIRLAPAGRAKD